MIHKNRNEWLHQSENDVRYKKFVSLVMYTHVWKLKLIQSMKITQTNEHNFITVTCTLYYREADFNNEQNNNFMIK